LVQDAGHERAHILFDAREVLVRRDDAVGIRDDPRRVDLVAVEEDPARRLDRADAFAGPHRDAVGLVDADDERLGAVDPVLEQAADQPDRLLEAVRGLGGLRGRVHEGIVAGGREAEHRAASVPRGSNLPWFEVEARQRRRCTSRARGACAWRSSAHDLSLVAPVLLLREAHAVRSSVSPRAAGRAVVGVTTYSVGRSKSEKSARR
jgi:hypothetical protein